MSVKFDVVIVGMGPAGMASAVELAELDLNIAIVDENSLPGGQIYRQHSRDFTLIDPSFMGDKYKKGRKLVDEFKSVKDKITLFNDTYIWGFFGENTLTLLQNGKMISMNFDKLLITEGATERTIPFPGWTLPGIITLGGLQKFVLHERLLPGKRFLLAGCSPLLLPVAANLLDAGAEVVGICDASMSNKHMKLMTKLIGQKGLAKEVFSYIFPVIKKSVPIMRSCAVTAASGESGVQRVTVMKLDKNGNPVAGSEKNYEVDILAVSYGFLPSTRLSRLLGCKQEYDQVLNAWNPETDDHMQTSVPGVYVAGDSGGIGGADMAEIEGHIAAAHMAGELGRLPGGEVEKRAAQYQKAKERISKYISVLNDVFAVRPGLFDIMDKDTIVCRCEQITLGQILGGIELGFRNINEMKRIRTSMGLCQGRSCEATVSHIMAQSGIPIDEIGYLGLRPPLSPLPVSLLEANAAELRS